MILYPLLPCIFGSALIVIIFLISIFCWKKFSRKEPEKLVVLPRSEIVSLGAPVTFFTWSAKDLEKESSRASSVLLEVYVDGKNFDSTANDYHRVSKDLWDSCNYAPVNKRPCQAKLGALSASHEQLSLSTWGQTIEEDEVADHSSSLSSSDESTRDQSASGDRRSNSMSKKGTQQPPSVRFTIFYSHFNCKLSVEINGFKDLPSKHSTFSEPSVEVCLESESHSAEKIVARRRRRTTSSCRLGSGPEPAASRRLEDEEKQMFDFQNLLLEKLQAYRLCLKVFANHGKRSLALGEAALWFRDVNLVAGTHLTVSKTIRPNVGRRSLSKLFFSQERDAQFKPNKEQTTSDENGEIFILLQYNATASRIKVLVQKASNLISRRGFFGNSEHYVVVKYLEGGEMIASKATRAIGGANPIWNEPFLFYIPSNNIENCCLEFLVMRERRYSAAVTLGRVLIGPKCERTGRSHWRSMLRLSQNRETALWHKIIPLSEFQSPE